MYLLDTEEQSVRDKIFLRALKPLSKCLGVLKSIERAIKNEANETYSNVQKRPKLKPKNPMETIVFFSIYLPIVIILARKRDTFYSNGNGYYCKTFISLNNVFVHVEITVPL